MILFKEDWSKYPNAIIDEECQNKSFIRLATLYKHMGVDNNAFILQLHNPDLIGVDPFDKNLSMDTKLAIALECKINFWYYLRSCVRMVESTPALPIPFDANRGIVSLYWLFFNHMTTILIMIRQTGKSTASDVLMRYLLNIRCTNTLMNLLTKDDKLRSANLIRVKNLEEELPDYLKQKTKKDIANNEEITIKLLINRYLGHLPSSSPKLAYKVGVGYTSAIWHIDEAVYVSNIGITLPAALAAGTQARITAEKKNEPYGTVITTTVGDADDRDGSFIYQLIEESTIWSENFFDCENINDLDTIIRNSNRKNKPRVVCQFNHSQLGKTDEWLKKAIESAECSKEDADRMFRNIWQHGTSSSPLPKDISAAIRASEVTDFYNQISTTYAYILRWYIPKEDIDRVMLEDQFVMGVDTSEAIGRDEIAIVIRSVKTGETIAVGNYNETNLITFSKWLTEVIVMYKNITVIIERRSTGGMILDHLILMLPTHGVDPFSRLYNTIVQNSDIEKEAYKNISRCKSSLNTYTYEKYRKYFGFSTSGTGVTSRSSLYGTTLTSACKHTSSLVKDIPLINQILSLSIRNGRVDHAKGGHDDLCVAWLLSYWLLSLGKNLLHYNIKSSNILIDNVNDKKLVTDLDKYEHNEEIKLKEKMNVLTDQIINERDDLVAYRMEKQLMHLTTLLSTDQKSTLSLNEFLDNIKKERRNRKLYK